MRKIDKNIFGSRTNSYVYTYIWYWYITYIYAQKQKKIKMHIVCYRFMRIKKRIMRIMVHHLLCLLLQYIIYLLMPCHYSMCISCVHLFSSSYIDLIKIMRIYASFWYIKVYKYIVWKCVRVYTWYVGLSFFIIYI